MRDGDSAFDALVIGAGPACSGAALRLRQLGYRVLLVERSAAWPRAQVGEALTPGVRNIITLLDANDALAAVPHVANASYRPPQPKPMAGLDPALPVRLHGAAAIVELPCVVDDQVCLHTALDHPHLERPLAFLDNEALFPHLAKLAQPLPLAGLLDMLTTSMSGRKAQRIAAWLWQHGLLESVG